MTFSEIEDVLGFDLPSSTRRYYWRNDKTQSYALGWLLADFVVDGCNLANQTVNFKYNPDRVKELLSKANSHVTQPKSKKSKIARDDFPSPCESQVLYYLERWNGLEDHKESS